MPITRLSCRKASGIYIAVKGGNARFNRLYIYIYIRIPRGKDLVIESSVCFWTAGTFAVLLLVALFDALRCAHPRLLYYTLYILICQCKIYAEFHEKDSATLNHFDGNLKNINHCFLCIFKLLWSRQANVFRGISHIFRGFFKDQRRLFSDNNIYAGKYRYRSPRGSVAYTVHCV